MAQLTTYVCDGCGHTVDHGTMDVEHWFRIEMTVFCKHGPNHILLDSCGDCGSKFVDLLAAMFPVRFPKDQEEARH
jgi:DNA-directed RNA polymerase subunit RPC12/RpoP